MNKQTALKVFELERKSGLGNAYGMTMYYPPQNAGLKGIILLVPGLGEDQSSYRKMAKDCLIPSSLALSVLEFPGDYVGGKRITDADLITCLDILDDAVKFLGESALNFPIFLYGHGIGANIALNYLIAEEKTPEPVALSEKPDEHGIKAAIFTSPWFSVNKGKPDWFMNILKFAAGIIPGMKIKLHFSITQLTDDEKTIMSLYPDLKPRLPIRLKLWTDLYEYGKTAAIEAAGINIPVLWVYSEQDSLINPDFIETLMKEPAEGRRVRALPGTSHEIHKSSSQDALYDEILDFLSEYSESKHREES